MSAPIGTTTATITNARTTTTTTTTTTNTPQQAKVDLFWQLGEQVRLNALSPQQKNNAVAANLVRSWPSCNNKDFVFSVGELNDIFSTRVPAVLKSEIQKTAKALDKDTLCEALAYERNVATIADEKKRKLAQAFRLALFDKALTLAQKTRLVTMLARAEANGAIDADFAANCRTMFVGDEQAIRECVQAANATLTSLETTLVDPKLLQTSIAGADQFGANLSQRATELTQALTRAQQETTIALDDVVRQVDAIAKINDKCRRQLDILRQEAVEAAATQGAQSLTAQDAQSLAAAHQRSQELIDLNIELRQIEKLMRDKAVALDVCEKDALLRKERHDRELTELQNSIRSREKSLESAQRQLQECRANASQASNDAAEKSRQTVARLQQLNAEKKQQRQLLAQVELERAQLENAVQKLDEKITRIAALESKCQMQGKSIAEELGAETASKLADAKQNTGARKSLLNEQLQTLEQKTTQIEKALTAAYRAQCESQETQTALELKAQKLQENQQLLEAEVNEKTSQVDALLQRLANKQKLVDQRQADAALLRTKVETMAKDLSEQKESTGAMREIADDLQTRFNALVLENQELVQKTQSVERQSKARRSTESVKVEELEARLAALDAELQIIDTERAKQKRLMDNCNSTLQNEKQKSRQLEQAMSVDSQQALWRQKQVDTLNRQKTALDAAVGALRGENERLEQELKQSQQEAADCAKIGQQLLVALEEKK